MKLMLTVAYDILKIKKKATLKQIFDQIKSEQKVFWKDKFSGQLMSTIEKRKMAELFTYLTTDGRFVMVDSKNWALAENFHLSKVKKLKASFGEVRDE